MNPLSDDLDKSFDIARAKNGLVCIELKQECVLCLEENTHNCYNLNYNNDSINFIMLSKLEEKFVYFNIKREDINSIFVIEKESLHAGSLQ